MNRQNKAWTALALSWAFAFTIGVYVGYVVCLTAGWVMR